MEFEQIDSGPDEEEVTEQVNSYLERVEDSRFEYSIDEEGVYEVEGRLKYGGPTGNQMYREDIGRFYGRFGDVVAYAVQQDEFPHPSDNVRGHYNGKIEKLDVKEVPSSDIVDELLDAE